MWTIEIKNLKKYYGKDMGIENVSINIKKGEIFGFIGPNGAGKSTTIRTLLNYIYKTEGTAKILGLDIEKDAKEIKEQIGYLPSEVINYGDMIVRDFLNYSAGFYKTDCSKRIIELSKRLSLDLNRKIEDLSFGNRKKVGIVTALLHSPKLLVLDEPTSGLDPLMQNIFFDILEEEKEKGTTIFFSSHVLSEITRICDKVAIIKDGKVIETAPVSVLTSVDYCLITIKSDEIRKLELVDTMILKEKSDDSVKFVFKGDINTLLVNITKLKIKDIKIEEPNIEEIFMQYYK